MQPSNQRSEMSSNKTSVTSGTDTTVVPNGKGSTADVQQPLPTRASRNERREQEKQQQSGEPTRLSLAELFQDGGDSDIDGNVEDESTPPDTLDSLSKRLGLKPEQVYSVKVPLADGAEPLTIGQLKDRIGELVDLETRETQFEQRRIRSEGDLLRAQAEIRDLVSMIPKEHIRPEMVNKLRERHNANMVREREATLEHIPEWQNEKRHVEDLQGITEMMSEYGFDHTFIGTVTDHRALKFLRDMYLRDKRIKAALAKVTIPDSKGYRGSAKTKRAPARPMENQSTSTRRTGAVPDQRSKLAALFNKSE